VATTCTLLTPAGTTKVSSAPVGPKVHVVVPAVVEQLPAAWAGLASTTPITLAARANNTTATIRLEYLLVYIRCVPSFRGISIIALALASVIASRSPSQRSRFRLTNRTMVGASEERIVRTTYLDHVFF
jgi:hypothetical protein